MDTTCAPADIHYPIDFSLLNEAREKLDDVIDIVHKTLGKPGRRPRRPVPAARMTNRSKFKNKQAQRYLDYKSAVGWSAKDAGVRMTDQPVTVEIDIYVQGQGGDWDN